MSQTISIVIPTLNEATRIGACISHAQTAWPDAEVCVVDAGSDDGTVEIAQSCGAVIALGPRNRGAQLNIGASRTRGSVLIFLHADCLIAAQAGEAVVRFLQGTTTGAATFRIRFDGDSRGYRIMEWLAKRDGLLTTYGDQGLVIRRHDFDSVGGFRELELFEDVAFFQAARKKMPIKRLDATISTSARKFEKHGILRQHTWNTGIHLLYHFGAPGSLLRTLYQTRPFHFGQLLSYLRVQRDTEVKAR